MVTLSSVATTMLLGTTDDFDPLDMDIANNALSSWFRNCKKAYIVQKERVQSLNTKPSVVVRIVLVGSVVTKTIQDATVQRWNSFSKTAIKPMRTGDKRHTSNS